jgi:hypothetical protein
MFGIVTARSPSACLPRAQGDDGVSRCAPELDVKLDLIFDDGTNDDKSWM